MDDRLRSSMSNLGNINDRIMNDALARGATVLPDLGSGLPEIGIDWEVYDECLTRTLVRLRGNQSTEELEIQTPPAAILRIPSNVILGEEL